MFKIEIEFCETSQNFNSFRQLLLPFFLSVVWLIWNFWGFMKFFFKQMLKVSALYLEKQKSFIPKKRLFRPLSISKQRSFSNFQWKFWQVWQVLVCGVGATLIQAAIHTLIRVEIFLKNKLTARLIFDTVAFRWAGL